MVCRLSQYEYTDYHHRSSRYSRYDCPCYRGAFRYGINIAQMNVTREKAGEKAIMIIEVDSRNCDEAIEEIRKIPHLHNVNFFK